MFRGADRLCIRFLNVGEGDATLIEYFFDGHVFRMLVDVGEADIEHTQTRMSCADHMRRLGISRLNLVVITHLHKDHAGGLNELRKRVHIDTILSGYMPAGRARMQVPEDAPKTVRGMAECVNQWIADLNVLKSAKKVEITRTRKQVHLAKNLDADFLIEKAEWVQLQHSVWEKMRRGEMISETDAVGASKLRNPASIRMRIYYRDRVIDLPADCYGAVWENSAQPCDILKVPHHGDRKSMTELLAQRLHPLEAVIPCADHYIARKDRPSADAIAMLRKQGARVWFTDAFPEESASHFHADVAFLIDENGAIHAPEGDWT